MTNGKSRRVTSVGNASVVQKSGDAYARETLELIRQVESRGYFVTGCSDDDDSETESYRVTPGSRKLAAYIGDTVWNAAVRFAVLRQKQALDELAVQALINAEFQSAAYGAIHLRLPDVFRANGKSPRTRSDAFEVAFALFPHLHAEMFRGVAESTKCSAAELCNFSLRMLVPYLVQVQGVLPMHPQMGGYCYAKPFHADAVAVMEKLGFYPRAFRIAQQASLFEVRCTVRLKKVTEGFLHITEDDDYDFEVPISDLYDLNRFPSRVGAEFGEIDVEEETLQMLDVFEIAANRRGGSKDQKVSEFLPSDFTRSATCHIGVKENLQALVELVYETQELGYETYTTRGVVVALMSTSTFLSDVVVNKDFYAELHACHVSAHAMMLKGLSPIVTSGKYDFQKV